ncbi:MAG: chloride channel protein [Bacteroidetes bacterium]|nr:chloride channel protein [Bacteroidota bacterium]
MRNFIAWRYKHVKDQPFILILSAVIGFSTGIAAVVIKNSVHLIRSLLTSDFTTSYANYLYLAYPLIGIFISMFIIKYLIRQRVGHGIPVTLYAISKQSSIIKKHNMFSSIITSAFTVGFGGSVGLEGPTVATGASIGSNIARTLHLNYRTRTLLIGCAASGALAAIFKAPIAAIVFAIEVIMLDLTLSSLVPLLLASSMAALTSYFFLGRSVLFHIDLSDSFLFREVPWFILLGVFTGFVSIYFTRAYIRIGKTFDKIKNAYIKVGIGGIILGTLIFLFPPLYGEGYESINSLLNGDFSFLLETSLFYSFKDNLPLVFGFLLLLIFFKAIATSVTLNSGGIGGIFAPSLFLGSTFGFLFASLVNWISTVLPIKNISLSNFTLIGMAGTIAGILHAPLTAIFLIAEITGGYELFVPLMITAAISYTTIKYFEKHSVYTYQLAKRGELLTHHKDKTVLALLEIDKLVETNFLTLEPEDKLSDLVKVIKDSVRNIYPVIDKNGSFLGLVPLDKVRKIMFDREMYDKVYVREIMIQPNAIVSKEDNMDTVMEKFKSTGKWNLPVIYDGKYMGFVSRANIFNAYRKLLIEFSED